MTELYINNQLIESIDTEIALTLSSFKLDSLGTRKGSYSNVFDLPKTNQTRQIFENCELVTSLTTIPYQKNTCKIIIDGQVIVDGSAVIRETKENYKVFISAGNSDFFKLIGTLKIKDVDLSEFDHTYNVDEVRERRESETGFLYPNIDYGLFEKITLNTWENETIQNREKYFQPSMWIKTILEKSFIELGYTLSGDLLSSQMYNSGIVLCRGALVKLEANFVNYRIPSLQLSHNPQKLNFTESSGGIKVIDDNDLYAFDNTTGIFQDVYTPGSADKENFIFEIFFDGNVTTSNLEVSSGQAVSIDLLIYDENGNTLETITRQQPFGFFFPVFGQFNVTETISINFSIGQTEFQDILDNYSNIQNLRFGWQISYSGDDLGNLRIEQFEFSINQVPVNPGQLGSATTINASNVLPQNETVGDLLITIANLEGIYFQVDESTKKVDTFRIDSLLLNKGNAIDWSNKLDLTDEVETLYVIENFAQKNLYRFAKDDKDVFLSDEQGQGVILVENANLATEKLSFESKFAPVPVLPAFLGRLPMGKVFTGNKYTLDGGSFILNDELQIEEFTPRICVVNKTENDLLQVDPQGQNQNTFNWEVNPLSTSFSRAIFKNYRLIKSVLVNTKVIKALFLLDLEDINNLDFKIPVYVEYFGEFFYIESINQFKINKRESCFVTLIRI